MKPLPTELSALVTQWRQQAGIAKMNSETPTIPPLDRRQCFGVSQAKAECADQLATVIASLPTEGWQPIETAPKDGSEILLWDGFNCYCGAWTGTLNGWHAKELCMEEPIMWHSLPPAPRETAP